MIFLLVNIGALIAAPMIVACVPAFSRWLPQSFGYVPR